MRASVVWHLSVVCISIHFVFGRQLIPSDGIQSKEWPCPVDGDIMPCVCTFDQDFNLFMDCSGATNIQELNNAFTADFPFLEFNSLTIDHTSCDSCSLTTLLADTFGSVGFEHVTITGTKIEVVEENALSASHDLLRVLDLHANQIYFFPFESLGDFTSLTSLNLANNRFNADHPIPDIISPTLSTLRLSSQDELVVSPGLVTNCPLIQNLYLRNSKIPEVPLFDLFPISMFSGLQDIAVLDFGINLITEIESFSIVSDSKTFITVDLSHNDISILHPYFISGFSSDVTSTLNMSYNSISRMDQEIWENIFAELPQENSIDLSFNPILCGCEIAWLVNSPAKASLTDNTTCEDGVQVVKELPPQWYTLC